MAWRRAGPLLPVSITTAWRHRLLAPVFNGQQHLVAGSGEARSGPLGHQDSWSRVGKLCVRRVDVLLMWR
jgi:hypothetical protein